MFSRGAVLIAGVLVLVLMLPAGVSAQDSGSTDSDLESTYPALGSPSGVIYELPTGRGRSDAAPKDGDGASSGSTYKSENGFGSSSKVPGYTPKGEKDSKASTEDDDDSGVVPLGSGPPPDSGDTSEWRTFGLVALILLIGAGVGVLAWQGRRRYSS